MLSGVPRSFAERDGRRRQSSDRLDLAAWLRAERILEHANLRVWRIRDADQDLSIRHGGIVKAGASPQAGGDDERDHGGLTGDAA